jgi:hypothetical protein
MRRSELIEDTLATIPSEKLIGAMIVVMQARRKRQGLDPDNFKMSDDPKEDLLKFMRASSVKQLKMFIEMAQGISVHRDDN